MRGHTLGRRGSDQIGWARCLLASTVDQCCRKRSDAILSRAAVIDHLALDRSSYACGFSFGTARRQRQVQVGCSRDLFIGIFLRNKILFKDLLVFGDV